VFLFVLSIFFGFYKLVIFSYFLHLIHKLLPLSFNNAMVCTRLYISQVVGVLPRCLILVEFIGMQLRDSLDVCVVPQIISCVIIVI
jgi:hypothetical protein